MSKEIDVKRIERKTFADSQQDGLLEHVREGGLAVVNVDLPETRAALAEPAGRLAELVTFGLTDHAELRVTEAYSDLDGTLFRINNWPKIGVGA